MRQRRWVCRVVCQFHYYDFVLDVKEPLPANHFNGKQSQNGHQVNKQEKKEKKIAQCLSFKETHVTVCVGGDSMELLYYLV